MLTPAKPALLIPEQKAARHTKTHEAGASSGKGNDTPVFTLKNCLRKANRRVV
jgi:hypothetical protein